MNLKILILLLIFCTGLINLSSAEIIGGEVYSSGSLSPAFQNVFVYSVEHPEKYVEVKVSPARNRYSFTNSIVLFTSSDLIRAEILDFENGFMAGPVDMALWVKNNKRYSCQDCNIFSSMELREVMLIKDFKKLVISPTNEFNFSANIYDDCDFELITENVSKKLCEGGCDYSGSFFGNLGSNKARFISDCKTGKRIKKSSNVQPNVSSEKRLIIGESSLKINFFGEVNGRLDLLDFIPDEYEVFNISDNGRKYSEDGYFSIEWKNISGNFNYTYFLIPRKKVRSCELGLTGNISLRESFSSNFKRINSSFNLKDFDFFTECNFSKDFDFFIVPNITLERSFSRGLRVGKKGSVNLVGEFPVAVSGVRVAEYVPYDFDISQISDGGILEDSNIDYQKIVWNFSGKSFDYTYLLKPKKSGEFFFLSDVGDNFLNEEPVSVSKFFQKQVKPSSGSGSSGGKSGSKINISKYLYSPKNFSKVTPNFPLIVKNKKNDLTVAFYSSLFKKDGAFEIFNFDYEGKVPSRKTKYLDSYYFETNLENSEFGKMVFNYKVNRSILKSKNFKDIKFYGLDRQGKFLSLTGKVISSNNNSVEYSFETKLPIKKLLIFGIKKNLSLWDKILIWLESLWN